MEFDEKGKMILSGLKTNEETKKKDRVGEGVVDDENIYATYPNKCCKCGYGFAQIIELGVWWSDEGQVTRLRCGKCGFSQNIGGKVT
jgi:DNA-directed RNA polymerase subunit M/transcription elongation factor TFIIS